MWYYFLHKDECITRFSYLHECTFKISTLTNNKKETDVTKNRKNFLAPRVQSPSVQSSRVQACSRPESRVQASSCPESKSSVIQSPRILSSRVQESRPNAQSPVFLICLVKHCHSNLNAIYCFRFCNNVL